MKKWIILGTCILGMLPLIAFTTVSQKGNPIKSIQSDEITAVINKNTSEQELEDLKKFFSENGIELLLKKIEFNSKNEIISLDITLKKGNAKSQYSSSSNVPISEIKLGYKNGSLYITNSGMHDIAIFKKQSGFNFPDIDMDSVMKKHSFTFDFSDNKDSLFLKGNFDIQKLKEQIMESFNFDEDQSESFFFNGQQIHPFQNSSSQKYNFIDNPDIQKLIIINGKEADFKTLDAHAKSDNLAEVDFLKPKTAISIYGNKAKDGAIIATTKK